MLPCASKSSTVVIGASQALDQGNRRRKIRGHCRSFRRLVWSGPARGHVRVVVRADGDRHRSLPGDLPSPAGVRLVETADGSPADRRSVDRRGAAVAAAVRHLGLPRGGRRHRSLRVLVGVRAGVDGAAVHVVGGRRHLPAAAGRHRRSLLPHLRGGVGQLQDARRK